MAEWAFPRELTHRDALPRPLQRSEEGVPRGGDEARRYDVAVERVRSHGGRGRQSRARTAREEGGSRDVPDGGGHPWESDA